MWQVAVTFGADLHGSPVLCGTQEGQRWWFAAGPPSRGEFSDAVIRARGVADVHRIQALVPAARATAVVAHGWRELAGGLERAYSLGEHPITRLKAVLNALSES